MKNRKGASYIGLLVVAAVIAVMCVFMMRGTGKKEPDTLTDYSHSEKTTTDGKAMDAGKAVSCQNNIAQVKSAISMYMQTNEAAPASLAELNLPGSMTKCAVSGEDYAYDPQNGRVSCPTHPQF